jgi:hypothetical protein
MRLREGASAARLRTGVALGCWIQAGGRHTLTLDLFDLQR